MSFDIDNIVEEKNRIRIKDAKAFVPSHIFENGQCFRFDKIANEHYIGVAMGAVIEVYKDGFDIVLENTDMNSFLNIWRNYFDLDKDYIGLQKKINVDSYMDIAIKYGYGLRLLRQEYFETLISFIISQNNHIPRIKKIISDICSNYGEPIIYKNSTYYAFPKQEALLGMAPCDFSFCKAGYRCSYLSNVVNGEFVSFNDLQKMNLEDAMDALMEIKGIGRKVASCVLLFSGINQKAFPIDVWVSRILSQYYGIDEKNPKKIYDKMYQYFNEEPGIAQQYLFYYMRQESIQNRKTKNL